MHWNEHEQFAVTLLKEKIQQMDGSSQIILFGSKARGDDDADSDIDILVLTDLAVDHKLEIAMRAIAFNIELQYDVIFGLVVMNRTFWDTKGRGMPLHWNIDKEGVAV